jgi:hypothetical protein
MMLRMTQAEDDPDLDGRSPATPDAHDLDDEPVETPFDHPLFLPAVLLALSLWFLWDGFIVPMEDHLTFNRVGFAVLAILTVWFGYKGLQEMRQDAEGDDDPR